MSKTFADRVVETTQTTGTGTLDLDGASTGFRTFVSGIGNGNDAAYVITDGVDWETGIGVVTDASPDTLSRVTVLASSNGGAKVNWSNSVANERDVFCAPLADNVGFDPGTVMLFHQTAAPNGWTKDTAATLDDSAIRIVTSTAWASGKQGATAFTSIFASGKSTSPHTLNTDRIPSHSHEIRNRTVYQTGGGSEAFSTSGNLNGARSQSEGGGMEHEHTLSLDLNYINIILASKD